MQKLRVGVLMGGKSLEKEVSFNSGRTICDHLDSARYSIIPLFQNASTLYLLPWHFLHRGKTTDFEHRLVVEADVVAWDDLKQHVDFIYIAQHGRYAEDGILQGFLEILGIPYLGSGVLASALRTDKIAHKTFLNNAGIATPQFVAVEPYGESFGVFKIFFVDAVTGKVDIYELDDTKTLTGPNRVISFARSQFPTIDWSTSLIIEPRPYIQNNELYWMLSIVPKDYAGISKTVFVNAATNKVTEEVIYGTSLTQSNTSSIDTQTIEQRIAQVEQALAALKEALAAQQ